MVHFRRVIWLCATPSVLCGALDGIGPRPLRLALVSFALASTLLWAINLTTVVPLHADWCCYNESTNLNSLIYGRCTRWDAPVVRMHWYSHSCRPRSWTDGEVAMMAMAGVTTGVWLIGAVAHVVSIALHVRRVALPPVRKDHPVLAEAHKQARRERAIVDNDVCCIFLLHRLRWIAMFDPVSVVFGLPAIACGLSVVHVAVQIGLSALAGGMAAASVLVHMASWRYYVITVFGSAAGAAALLHHVYVCGRMVVYVAHCVQDIEEWLDSHTRATSPNAFKTLHDMIVGVSRSVPC